MCLLRPLTAHVALSLLTLYVTGLAIKFTKSGGVELRVTGRRLDRVSSLEQASSSSEFPASPSPSVASSAGETGHSGAQQEMARYRLDFSIKDSGIGITPEQLALLFHTFSQVQHMSGEYGGTGLGKQRHERKDGGVRGDDAPFDARVRLICCSAPCSHLLCALCRSALWVCLCQAL